MQDPNEDTEWNDLMRQRGILPQKEPEVTEEALSEMIEQTIQEKQSSEARLCNLNLDELNEVEDDEDEDIILMFRQKRIAEIKAKMSKDRFGDIMEISANDYVEKVNKAGDGIWVILHLYKQGITLCTLINQYLGQLAYKYPQLKVLKAISTTCIPNYPDRNLPTIFVYYEGTMRRQFVGPLEFGGEKLKYDELEWMLSKAGAFDTDIEEDPRGDANALTDALGKSVRRKQDSDDSADDDW